jgi:hypothetical protein
MLQMLSALHFDNDSESAVEYIINHFTYAHNCCNQATGALGVSPPRVAEYPYRANHGLLVPLKQIIVLN